MSHLDPERLAALADDYPTAAELAHLALCGECRGEREAYRELLALAVRERDSGERSLTTWQALATSLREQGLLAPTGSASSDSGAETPQPATRNPQPATHRWMQAAAAVLLIGAGAMGGRLSVAAGPEDARLAGDGDPSAQLGELAAYNPADTTGPRFGSVTEAQAALTRADREYRLAMTYLAANDTARIEFRSSDLYRARLAALDAMAGAARDGVDEFPHDPVLNQAYLQTLAVREATLRQLGSTLPAGVRLTQF
ncbi:MAG: hypothetical protein M3373_08290 [Gemmatimonadota bacterium]|nr:hypothetical protein [Gemmatimonadota bacterium]